MTSYCIRKEGLPVKPMSTKSIREIALAVRSLFGIKTNFCDVVGIVELFGHGFLSDFSFEVVDDNEESMKGKWAETFPDKKLVRVKNSVYIKACEGDGQARYTIAHELGHLFLRHRFDKSFSRYNGDLPRWRDSEWQADTFAAELLMCVNLVMGMTANEIAEKCVVSYSAAETRRRKLDYGK